MFWRTKNRMLLLDKLMNGSIRVIYTMSKKRSRFSDSAAPECESDNEHSFDFANVSKSHSVPGATDELLRVLRNMSNCHKRKSTEGHIIYITVDEFYQWVFTDVTPEKMFNIFSENLQLDDDSSYATLRNQPRTQTMSEIVGAFFQQYILYDQVFASLNRRNIKLLTANELLRSLTCFKDGTVAMKLAQPVSRIDGEQVTEILFKDLPSKERNIFLQTKIPFFVLSDLSSAEESAYIKFNNHTD